MTTRRERKEIEAREAKEREILRRRERRLRWTAIGLGSVLTVSGGLITLWKHLPDSAGSRDPASTGSQALKDKIEDQTKEKTLDQVKQELLDKEYKQHKSKEWAWAEEGRTDKVIESYKEHLGKGSAAREERVRLINLLGRTLKPRSQWPAAFNDQRANEIVEFLNGILTGERAPGPEPAAAVNNLAAVAKLVPELRPKAEKAIVVYYGSETRPGPRGECLQALSSFLSPEGLKLAEAASRGSDTAMVRAGIYALADYTQDPKLGEEARKALREVAKSNPTQRALAVKLLAHYGDRQIASMVPTMLRADASPPEIEAGAYAVGHLKLKQYKDLLIERSDTTDPFLRRQIDEAVQLLNQ